MQDTGPGQLGHGSHFKIKRTIMNKFFNEPVDALDLRLTKAEAILTVISDPWKVKVEAGEPRPEPMEPLDFSEYKVTSSSGDQGEAGAEDRHVQFIMGSSLTSYRDQHHHHHHHPQSLDTFPSSSIIKHTSSTPSSSHLEYHHHHHLENQVNVIDNISMMVTRYRYIFAACTAQFGSLSSIHIKRSVDKFSCWSELCRRFVILFADHFASNRLETENNESFLDKKIHVAENYSSHCEDQLFSLSTRSF